jgi:hypothetical protein
MGAATARIPTHHAMATITSCVVGPPIVRSRTAVTTADSGWCSAQYWSQSGIDSTGTNALEAKTSGAKIGKAAACAVSGSPTRRPTVAKIHDKA